MTRIIRNFDDWRDDFDVFDDSNEMGLTPWGSRVQKQKERREFEKYKEYLNKCRKDERKFKENQKNSDLDD